MSNSVSRSSPVPAIVRGFSVWYRAARPFTLSAAIVPVLVGSALAFQEGHDNPVLFVLVLLASLLVQVTANLVDEYSDHARPEGKEKLLAPYKVIALGLLSSRSVKIGAITCFGIATVIGLYLIHVTGWPILVMCVSSGAVAYFYSAGPRPLGTLGLGHPLVFLFMGPVMVLGAYYVQTHSFTLDAGWLSLAVGCTVTAILVANDLRDSEEDRVAGKATVISLFGTRFGRWEWTVLVVASYGIVVAMAITGRVAWLALLCLLALPEAVGSLQKVWKGKDRAELAIALRASSRLHLLFGFLVAVGLVMGRYVRI